MIADLPPPIFDPPAYVEPVKSRRDRQGRRDRKRSRHAIYAIGAIIILTDDDGTKTQCRITHQTPDGTFWCLPLSKDGGQ